MVQSKENLVSHRTVGHLATKDVHDTVDGATHKIEVYDTTLRDGSQGFGITFTVADKLKLAAQLAEFGVPFIEGGWPGSNPRDQEFFARARHLDLGASRLAAFGSTRRSGVKAADDANLNALLQAETPVVTIVGKSWDLHVAHALEVPPAENLDMIGDSVAFLHRAGRQVIYDAEHFFDGYRANPDFAMQTLRVAADAGADWIVLCDTNGGSLPEDVARIWAKVVEEIETPLGIHPHNDCGLAVAVALAAVKAGARQVQGTLNGYGERNGNLNLVTLLPVLELKLGYRVLPPGQLNSLTHLARFAADLANLPLDPQAPFVGTNAFAHKGGLHVSAVMKRPDTYEHVDPALVGNQRQVVVSDLSGRSNLLFKAQAMGLELDGNQARELLEMVKHLELEGLQFDSAEASLELLARRHLMGLPPLFELSSMDVRVEQEHHLPPRAQARLALLINGQRVTADAVGPGPVGALDLALRKALLRQYPVVKDITLVDYRVSVLGGDRGTGARVRVLIESEDQSGSWVTVGASENILEASWQALADSVEYGLRRALGWQHDQGSGQVDGAGT